MRLQIHVPLVLVTFAATLSLTFSLDAGTVRLSPRSTHALDRDGDGEVGEATAIRGRVRAYLDRHGDPDGLTAETMLRRSRWSYDRHLERSGAVRTQAISGRGWISLGPVNGAGRATRVAPHPSLEGTVLIGAAGGGVWRTTDGGQSWTPLTDGLPDLSVGALTYAPSDPNVVYLGTGEGGFAIDFIPGIGLVRSEDGGDTWILPTTVIASQFYDLAVDPRDPDTLLAATNEGLLRSVDGGVTWSQPIAKNPTGPSTELAVTGLVRSTSNPDLLYASIWCYSTCPSGFSRVMRSTDNGTTWTPAGTGLPAASSQSYSFNRGALAMAPSNDGVLYLGVTTRSATGSPLSAIWKTTNGGTSWAQTGATGDYLGQQGWYDNTITVHPTDPNRVVAGGVWYVLSANGGLSWTQKNPYASNDPTLPHVDAHDLEWQGATLWLGCDGGIWTSTNSGTNWVDRNAGLVTRQYYGLAIDPVNRERMLAGSQDNGTDRRRDAGDDTWDFVLGGDGFECAINPLIPDIMYGTIYDTTIYRSTDGGEGRWENVSPSYGSDDAPFITPLTLRGESPAVLYTGTTRIWRSEDGGDAWSPLPTDVINGSWNDTVVWGIAVTQTDPNVLMVAKGSDVYRSEDGGTTWRQAPRGTTGLPGRRVVNVEISPFDAEVAAAALAGSTGANLYLTTDGGATWQPSATGLPPFSVQVVRWDPTDASTVYAGTDVGLYRSSDGGTTWQEYGEGLPAASIHDLRILPDGSMMRVATHGRGVWELDIEMQANSQPTVAITSPTGGVALEAGDSLGFVASASDIDGDVVALTWFVTDLWRQIDGGSGSGSVDSTISYRFDVGGEHLVAVQARDSDGAVGVATMVVEVDDPANDCASPRLLPGGGPFPLTLLTSNTAASTSATDPSPPCVSDPQDSRAGTWGSMWFEFTPVESHRYVVTTCGSTADTVLTAWTGLACGPFTPVIGGCNDDDENIHCDGRQTDSYLELDLVAGQTYRFMVGSYALSSKGKIRLTIDCADCTPTEPERLYFVPAAAHATGVGETFWVTDLHLHNPDSADVGAEVAFLPASTDNTTAVGTATTVPAGESLELLDVVSSLLGRQGSGALRLRATGSLLVASRTYNRSANETFGQFIAGQTLDAALPAGGEAVLPGLERTSRFRTNIGFASTAAAPATVEIELRGELGELLATRTETVASYGWLQVTDIFDTEGLSDVEDAYALIRNLSPSAGVLVYASVVDARTGDPVYLAPQPVTTAGSKVWIAAAAHTSGIGDSFWQTDLAVVNTGATSAAATLVLHLADRDNSGGDNPTAALVLQPGHSLRLADAVRTLFGLDQAAGAIAVNVTAGELTMASRTYTTNDIGTFGQLIAPIRDGAAASTGEDAVLVQLRRSTSFRTNVGLVNLSAQEITVEAEYFNADGSSLGRRSTTLPPYAYTQTNRAVPGSNEVVGGFAVLTTSTSGGRFLAYASVVDNVSGDPTFIPATVVR